MKDGVDFIHRKIFLDLNDEEVDHLLVRLKQVNGVVTLTNKDLTVFAGQKLHELLVDDGGMPKFERTIDQGYVVRVVMR